MMKMLNLAVLALVPLVFTDASPAPLKIGAWNIKTFGPTKAGKADVMDRISKTMSNYDVILIQEIRDVSQNIMVTLLDLLNTNTTDVFAYNKSERLGRSSYKEQYAYYYKTNRVSINATHQYNDTNDVFEREPFSVLVHVNTTDGAMQIALTGIHVKPNVAPVEIRHLHEDVYNDTKTVFSTENIFILGDLNADCSYLTDSEKQAAQLLNGTIYLSLIPDDFDTTTYTTHCAYDRIFVRGDDLRERVFASGVDLYDVDLGLTDTETKAVSDHYPVMASIRLD